MLFVSNVKSVVDPSGRRAISGLAAGLAETSALFNILNCTISSNRVKSSSISQRIKGKSRDIQQLLKYFNETTTFSV